MDSEHHWNTICLGIVTIASAAVGTAIFASGLADIDLLTKDERRWITEVLKLFLVGIAIFLYMALTALSGIAIFRTADANGNRVKSQRTMVVYCLFLAEVFALVALLAVDLFDDQIIQWLSQSLTPQKPAPSPP